MHYGRFLLMIAVSTIAMFGMMYLNTYVLDHVYASETRVFMSLVMGSGMAVIMLRFMRRMYGNKTINMIILAGAAVVFCVSLWLLRSQATVHDVAWMKAMIPHHSIAIMTSSRANLSDPRVIDLAKRIIEAQEREIIEMQGLIRDLEK